MAKLTSSFNDDIDTCAESTSILYFIGQLNPYKITKFPSGRKVTLNMNYYAIVKLGKLNIQNALGKHKYTLSAIGKAFYLKKLKYNVDNNKSSLECKFIIQKSHKIFLKAYELAKGFNRKISSQLDKNLHTECSKISAPYHIDTCFTYYNSDRVKNQQLRKYLKTMLKEIDKFETQ